MDKIKSKKGFTIIEVVLVLAIAGLIFLMVFLALPALQRNQRNTARGTDLSRVVSQLQTYQSNNRGQVPVATGTTGTWQTFFREYLLEGNPPIFSDPSGFSYSFRTPVALSAYQPPSWPNPGGTIGGGDPDNAPDATQGGITIVTGATCSGETPVAASGNNSVAFLYAQEGAGTLCRNN
jgi:prepilin-type N-terminal cleavage/methylation domain-containing protein